MNDFTPVGVRARGLLAHLLSRAELEALAGADGPSLARGLARSGRLLGPVGDTAQAAELERAMRETTKRHLATLARWDGAAPVLEVFAADQDRRSVRALLRGALQAAPTERRLSGLVPTASLPERVLAELARQPTPADVVAHLFALGHPDADRLLPMGNSVLLAERIPGARLEVLPGAGHDFPTERPDEVSRRIADFFGLPPAAG